MYMYTERNLRPIITGCEAIVIRRCAPLPHRLVGQLLARASRRRAWEAVLVLGSSSSGGDGCKRATLERPRSSLLGFRRRGVKGWVCRAPYARFRRSRMFLVFRRSRQCVMGPTTTATVAVLLPVVFVTRVGLWTRRRPAQRQTRSVMASLAAATYAARSSVQCVMRLSWRRRDSSGRSIS
jgi:hypothetical protein